MLQQETTAQTTKKDFKKGINSEENRRRREANTIKIRKDKKEEGLAKKRNVLMNNFMSNEINKNEDSTNVHSVTSQSFTFENASASKLVEGLVCNDNATQINCLRSFRRLLSKEQDPPIQECIDCGAVPLFVQFLQRNDCPELQFEAAWALTNIASTDRTRLIAESNAIPHLVNLLMSDKPDIREQSAWCLGNVAGDGSELRDIVLAHNALPPLLVNISQPASLSLLRNCTWSMSNFCRGKPQPPLNLIAPILPVLTQLIVQNVDPDTIVDAMWALSYVSDGDDMRIQSVVDLGVIPHLVTLLNSKNIALIVPALRTLGNIVSGNDSQTQAVLNANVLPALVPLFNQSKRNIRKEVCWMLSNIAAGSKSQIEQLFLVHDLIPRVLGQLSSSVEWDVRKEAAWVISNIATTGNAPQVNVLVEQGAITPLCELLEVNDVKILMIAMEALEAILTIGKIMNNGKSLLSHYLQLIDEAEGVDHLEKLQEHENNQVYLKAVHIIETFFGSEDDNGQSVENIAPLANNQTFQFGFAAVQNSTKSVETVTGPLNPPAFQFHF